MQWQFGENTDDISSKSADLVYILWKYFLRLYHILPVSCETIDEIKKFNSNSNKQPPQNDLAAFLHS